MTTNSFPAPIIRYWGLCHYLPLWRAMKAFTEQRTHTTPDELWVLEHFPVYTQGLAGKPEHLLNPNSNIPVIHTNRGGQITYHGPGQLILYTLIDLKRHNLNTTQLVTHLEQAVITLLKQSFNLTAHARQDARGVYVDAAKICSIGLRIRQHKAYHGLALNVNMDTTPFTHINPCGLPQLPITQLAQWDKNATVNSIAPLLIKQVLNYL